MRVPVGPDWPFVILISFHYSDFLINSHLFISPLSMLYGKKAITDRSVDTDIALDCDTVSDLSHIGDENEESNSDIGDSSVDESDYDQVDANTVTGRDNCTVSYNECL